MDYSYRYLMEEAKKRYSDGGITSVMYNFFKFIHIGVVRPRLVYGKNPRVNGVEVGSRKFGKALFDGLVPWDVPGVDEYKKINSSLIREHVGGQDTVGIIGGGIGVSTVVASEAAEDGKVVSYEASERRCEILKETVRANAAENVDVRNAIVGPAIDVAGKNNNADQIGADELREFDVIEMDCEGAEVQILGELSRKPSCIIVETHPNKGAATATIEDLLEDKGYVIVEKHQDPSSGHVLLSKIGNDSSI